MKVYEALEISADRIGYLDSEILVCHSCDIDNVILSAYDDLTHEQQVFLNECIERRIRGEPIAFITGKKDFWKHTFYVTPDVLIPRPDTELIIESVLALEPSQHKALKFLDLGTGSGCIIISLLNEYPNATGVACDISAQALSVCHKNSTACYNRLEIVKSDWFTDIEKQKFDIIVSNPPYIRFGDPNTKGIDYEPDIALYAGQDGLACYEEIAKGASGYMHSDSFLLLECGYDQSKDVANIFLNNGLKLRYSMRDLNDIERVLVFKL